MARKTFSSDFDKALPKARMEPYRLWFEYLKLAQALIPAEVDKTLYADWGNFAEADFDDWFQDHWHQLFAIPASVTEVLSEDDYRAAEADEDIIIVSISRQGTITQKIDDLRKLLDINFGKSPKKFSAKPRFEISAKRNVHYPSLRQKLRFLEYFHEKKTVEEAALLYLDWANNWNKKVGIKSPRKTVIPKSIARFGKALIDHREDLKRLGRAKKSPEYNAARSDMVRYVKSGQKVLRNVAGGVFPGAY